MGVSSRRGLKPPKWQVHVFEAQGTFSASADE